ncbi:hypothetical protein NPIL_366051 [Nephila pilipes]|uniref:Uncharacterized protein n=1 Tax=Nephila pilipes TaxID=299642 RepID=A0A8X6ICT6_NEPPI|nr:hypothetical protein NPIL_366051 [Nephila pilipes]
MSSTPEPTNPEARFKYSTLKQEEIKNELAQFNNLCTAWGIANPHVLPNASPAKQRGNFRPSEKPKKQKKNDENPFYNRFGPFPIDEPSTQIKIDEEDITDPVPSQTTPTTTKNKKTTKKTKEASKTSPMEKPASQPCPVQQQTNQPSTSTAPLPRANTPATTQASKSSTTPPITTDNVINSTSLLKELQNIIKTKLSTRLIGTSLKISRLPH